MSKTKSKYTDTDLEYMEKTINSASFKTKQKRDILNIIKECAPDTEIYEDGNECRLWFHKFDDIVYDKINNYIENHNKSINQELLNYTQSEMNEEDEEDMTRMSNRERQLINRHKFDQMRTQENERFTQMTKERVLDSENPNNQSTTSDN